MAIIHRVKRNPLLFFTFAISLSITTVRPNTTYGKESQNSNNIRTVSLEKALSLAQANSLELKIIDSQIEMELQAIDQFVASSLPQLTFESSAARTSTPLLPSFQARQIPGGPQGDRSYDNHYNLSLQLQSTLWAFGRTQRVPRIASLEKQILDLSKLVNKNNFYIQIIRHYAAALTSKENLNQALEDLQHAKTLGTFTQIEYQSGSINQIEYLRSQSLLTQKEAEKIKAQADYDSKLNRLNIIMGLSREGNIQVEEGFNLNQDLILRAKKLSAKNNDYNSIELKKLKVENESLLESYEYEDSRHLPELYVFAGVTSAVNNAGQLRDPDDPDTTDVFESNRYQYQIGISLKWTIYDSGLNRSKSKIAYNQWQAKNYELQNAVRRETNDRQQSIRNLNANLEIFAAAQKTLEAAKLAFEFMDTEYKSGSASLSQWLETQKDVATANLSLAAAYEQILTESATVISLQGEPIL